jgi:hypothetical protein
MRSASLSLGCLGAALLILLLLGLSGGAAGTPTSASASTPPVAAHAPAWLGPTGTELLLSEGVVFLLGLPGCGVLVAGLAAVDAWLERRAGATAWIGGQITAALQRDRLLKGLAVTPIVHLPLWGRAGGTVELRGHVPTPGLRYAVQRAVELEAGRHLPACQIADRLVIGPRRAACAA